MNKYTIYCTKEQTRKAFELGAPIKVQQYVVGQLYEHSFADKDICYYKPTAEEMIGWLEGQGIMINITHQLDGYCLISVTTEKEAIKTDIEGSIYRKTATLAAIDTALNYLSNKNFNY